MFARPFSGRGLRLFSLLLICLLTKVSATWAIDIDVSSNWTRSVGVTDLSGGPGSDLNSSYESSTSQAVITISGTSGSGDAWRVDVRKSDTVWDASLHLDVRRTSSGFGFGSISGGTSYLEVTSVDQSFFSGSGDRTLIFLQLRISGVSVSLDATSFSTSVTYTVIDT